MEARDRRPVRPSPGDRGSWSHGPVSRVNPRPATGAEADQAGSNATGGTQARGPYQPTRRPLPAVAPPRSPMGMDPRQVMAGAPVTPPARPPMPLPNRPWVTPYPPRPGAPSGPRASMPPGRGFGLPSLRRNVCPHFYMTGTRGAIPIQAPHLLKGLLRQPSTISRCQLRGGVHLDEGFVNDVCLTPRFNQCVFYEDELTRE